MALPGFVFGFHIAITVVLVLPALIGLWKLARAKRSGWVFLAVPVLFVVCCLARLQWFKLYSCNGQPVAEMPPDQNLVGFFGKGVQALAVPEHLCGAGCQKTLAKVKPAFLVMLDGETRRSRLFEPMTSGCLTPIDFDGTTVCASEVNFALPNDVLTHPTYMSGEFGDIDLYWLDPGRPLEVRSGKSLNIWVLNGYEPSGFLKLVTGYGEWLLQLVGVRPALTCH